MYITKLVYTHSDSTIGVIGIVVIMLIFGGWKSQDRYPVWDLQRNHYFNALRHIYICYLLGEVGIVRCVIHCIMHVHSSQGGEIVIGLCP